MSVAEPGTSKEICSAADFSIEVCEADMTVAVYDGRLLGVPSRNRGDCCVAVELVCHDFSDQFRLARRSRIVSAEDAMDVTISAAGVIA